MNAINFSVGANKYQLMPHTGFTAINLDRKVLGIMGRMARAGLDAGNELQAFAVLSSTISDLSDKDYRWIVETTLSAVTVVNDGQKFRRLENMDVIADHFASNFQDVYAVMLKVWELEKLSPFAIAPTTEQSGN